MRLHRMILMAAMALGLVLIMPASARAQINCNFCDQLYGSCDQSCYTCDYDYPDGSCPPQETHYTTCGDQGLGCIPSGCTPNWNDSAELRGTYGEGFGFGCAHHRVEWVTHHDVNHCNTNSANWTTYSCDDSIDGWIYWVAANCCDCSPSNDFCCDDHHSCF